MWEWKNSNDLTIAFILFLVSMLHWKHSMVIKNTMYESWEIMTNGPTDRPTDEQTG